ncbi:alpha beta-hydrolase [Diplodia corticola]|uniref:Alpha beta-hydrolase n=1 Tax=Diplodia corticola TaxID=236234 RepID=A0A1J9RUY3_9PEZI|nr:alpha beta-hydrolase [Diplodia corticola]OJD32231.1 alpha beta-hydrolase [Diplodia corticola]
MLSRPVFLALALELAAASAHNHPGQYSPGSSTPEDECSGVNAISPACSTGESLHHRDIFYVGGRYVETTAGNLTYDQLYVEKLTPANGVFQPNPVIFFHGGGTSGVTWLNTPDNRKGFASYFLDLGYQVYIVDQTSVGHGSEEDLTNFPMRIGSTAEISEDGFTAVERANLYPQSQLHTQWPGTGLKSDPTFDAFESTFIPLTSNLTAQELSMRASGCALLALIATPSFFVSHSIGALHPLLLSNDCPALVAGSVNLEPANVPFVSYLGNATHPGTGASRARPWGLANTHLTYDPAVADPTAADLAVRLVGPDRPERRACYLQAHLPRRLPRVARVPYVALTSEASPHATYDHCVVEYLRQAGVPAEWIRLAEDAGVRGNAHFMHLERNNWEIVGVVHAWIEKVVGLGGLDGDGEGEGGDGGGEGQGRWSWWGWGSWWRGWW